MTNFPKFDWQASLIKFAFVVVVIIGGFFRFFNLRQNLEFTGDEGRAALAARDIALGHLTLLGPETSIKGFHLGPFFYYLSALPVRLANFDPVGIGVMTAFFGVVTCILLYYLGRKFWSIPTGLVLALTYAFSPLAIQQSRIGIEPAPLPFFSVLWLYAMASWQETPKKRWLVLAAICIFLGLQLNFSMVALIPATLWLWLEKESFLSLRWRILSQKLLILLCGVAVLARIGIKPSTSLSFFWWNWQHLISGNLVLPAAIILGLYIFALWYWHLQNKQPISSLFKVVVIWFVFGMFGFLLKRVNGEHSLALLFPLPALLISRIFDVVRKKLPYKFILPGLLILWLIMSNQAWLTTYTSSATTLPHQEALAKEISRLSDNQPYNFMYRGHLDVYADASDHIQYLLWWQGHQPVQNYLREVPQPLQRQTIVLYAPPFSFEKYSPVENAFSWNQYSITVQKPR